MSIDKVLNYPDVIAYLNKNNRQKHLLLGNGFSMAYDPNIFSYNALNKFIDELDNEILVKLFHIINTRNFEIVMQQLDNFCAIAKAFGSDKQLVEKIHEANLTLQNSLIEAIKELHPEHVFTIPEKMSHSCISFLNEYILSNGNVFTSNYDLLLYWILMRNHTNNAIDGFGRELLNENIEQFIPEEDLEYSELRWGVHQKKQNIHYLHGALPFFDTGVNIIKEEYKNEKYLLENIKARLDNLEYPIFVTAGNGREKLTHIMHNQYLTFCYEKLTSIQGSLVTFGFNFGEYDEHIIDAINIAAKHGKRGFEKLLSIYIGVYSESDLNHIRSIESKFKCRVNVYDAKTANVWN